MPTGQIMELHEYKKKVDFVMSQVLKAKNLHLCDAVWKCRYFFFIFFDWFCSVDR